MLRPPLRGQVFVVNIIGDRRRRRDGSDGPGIIYLHPKQGYDQEIGEPFHPQNRLLFERVTTQFYIFIILILRPGKERVKGATY